jgi:hypothetical protein
MVDGDLQRFFQRNDVSAAFEFGFGAESFFGGGDDREVSEGDDVGLFDGELRVGIDDVRTFLLDLGIGRLVRRLAIMAVRAAECDGQNDKIPAR